MNVTKSISESVSAAMVEPITLKIKELNEKVVQIAYAAIQAATVPEVIKCYKQHSDYFRTCSTITLANGCHVVHVANLPKFPAVNPYYPRIETDAQTIESIDKLQLEIEKVENEKCNTSATIVSTLLSLKTMKKIKANFPEAYKHLEQYEKKKSTAIALPIADILSSLKRYVPVSK